MEEGPKIADEVTVASHPHLNIDVGGADSRGLSLPVVVRDVMTPKPITVEPTATVKDIAHVLLENDVRCVPVVDIGDQLVGVVSEADLLCREGFPSVRSHHLAALIDEAVAEHHHHWKARAEGLTAEEIMTPDVITCAPGEPVGVVVRRMLRRGVRTLPVIEDGRLVGVLSRHDLLRLFDRPDSEIRARVGELLDAPFWAPEGHAVQAEILDGVVILTGSVLHPSDRDVVYNRISQVPATSTSESKGSCCQTGSWISWRQE